MLSTNELYILLFFLLAFLIKLAFIFEIADMLKDKVGSRLGTICGAWIIEYIYMILGILVLSMISLLTRELLLVWFVIPIIILQIRRKHHILREFKFSFNFMHLIVAALILYEFIHSLFYMDSTWDSHTYGITRILLFCQNKSVLVNMKTFMLNLFTNEWNSELNAIYYRIIIGKNQGISFGNAENFFYGIFTVLYFFEQYNFSKTIKLGCAILIITQPILFALSMTIKGDFLVVFFMILSCVYFKMFIREKSNLSLVLLLLTLALMAGSKISMVPFAGICGIVILLYSIKEIRNLVKGYLVGGIGVAIACSRYILNLIEYGNPFKRVDADTERVIVSLSHLLNNIYEILKSMIAPDSFLVFSKRKISILNLNLGWGILIIFVGLCICIIYRIIHRKRFLLKPEMLFLIPYIFSFIIFGLSTNWYDFSFRYYLPWLILAEMFALVLILNVLCSFKVVNIIYEFPIIIIALIVCYDGVSISRQYAEITPWSIKDARWKNSLEREYGAHQDLLYTNEETNIMDCLKYIEENKNVLVCTYIDCLDSWFFGRENTNKVTFCDKSKLEDLEHLENYDAISISNVLFDEETGQKLEDWGYICLEPKVYYFYPEYYGIKFYVKEL